MTDTTTDAGHTPGPWIVEETEDILWVGNAKAAFPSKVADVVHSIGFGRGFTKKANRRALANARLIAAAPEMCEALETALLAINPPDKGGISLSAWNKRLKHASAEIRAALTAARNQQEAQDNG